MEQYLIRCLEQSLIARTCDYVKGKVYAGVKSLSQLTLVSIALSDL